MSSSFLSLKLTLASTALAGLVLLACGSDDPAPTTKDNSSSTDKDAGTKKDAGSTKKDAGASAIPQGEPGDDCEGTTRAQCSDCDSAPCFTTCEDGTYGDCKSVVAALKDGGLGALLGDAKVPNIIPDGGSITVKDGSVSVNIGDASLDLPQEECPDPTVCSTMSTGIVAPLLMMAANGAPFCGADDGVGLPPTCTVPADCVKLGFKSAQCLMIPGLGSYCLQVCKDK